MIVRQSELVSHKPNEVTTNYYRKLNNTSILKHILLQLCQLLIYVIGNRIRF